ncbi:MAG: arylsulfatase, partial [Sediminibacterium sp.]|nr:arylsulfatase [Sediminibacterium sp.]
GIWRGGKYSTFEAGSRVPFIISWTQKIKPAVSDALVSQIDLLASFSHYFAKPAEKNHVIDSENIWEAFIGKSKIGRTVLIEQGMQSLAIVKNNWKYIEPNKGAGVSVATRIELGNSLDEQLYNLTTDPSEKINLAQQHPELVAELKSLLRKMRD